MSSCLHKCSFSLRGRKWVACSLSLSMSHVMSLENDVLKARPCWGLRLRLGELLPAVADRHCQTTCM